MGIEIVLYRGLQGLQFSLQEIFLGFPFINHAEHSCGVGEQRPD